MLEFKLQHFQENAKNSLKKCYNIKSQHLTWVGPKVLCTLKLKIAFTYFTVANKPRCMVNQKFSGFFSLQNCDRNSANQEDGGVVCV